MNGKGGPLKKISIIIVILLILPQISFQASKNTTEILCILEQQKKLWNEGNIEGFMEYYWNSESFTFQSGNNRLQGWKKLLSRYKRNYPTGNMGTLDFTDLMIKVLSDDFAFAIGRWKLTQKDSSPEGLFSLIFQRMSDGWKIIHDHTSSKS